MDSSMVLRLKKMEKDVIDGVVIERDERIELEEAMQYLADEQEEWKVSGKELARIELILDGDMVIVKAVEKSPVKRVRRITGYLSNMENFNDGKKAELAERYKHM